MLTLVATGRDDDYGVGFLERLYTSISKNIELLEKYGIVYEYHIVEWSPIRSPLSEHPMFENLFKEKNMKDILVPQDVAVAENLNPKVFFEYFAKNVGVRFAQYPNLLILNSDIVLSDESVSKIKVLLNEGLNPERFYRILYRTQVDNALTPLKKETIFYPQNPDAVICGWCSGDFLFLKTDTFVKYGEGYDETNVRHRTISQTGMDGEILWNLHKKDILIEFIDSEYYHINHGKPHTYDGEYNMAGYRNKVDWGLIGYKHTTNEKKQIIISNERK